MWCADLVGVGWIVIVVLIPKYEYLLFVFFFKQKTAYEIGTGDWSSDVCSSDLIGIN